MRVARISNFDDEMYSQAFITMPGLSEKMAEAIKRTLNNEFSSSVSPDYYRVVADDYKLYEFEP
jgi:hypothetical protein